MAAPIITCPACTKKFKTKAGLEGKRIKCPLCATPFVVPAVADQAKAKPAGAGSASAQRVSWNAEDDNSDPYKLGEFDIRPRCPNCANLMESKEAVVCLFCGYNTQTREWGKTVKAMSITGSQHFMHMLPGIIFLTLLLVVMYGVLYFSLELPRYVVDTWASFLDHESMRMWIILILLAFMWVFGVIGYKRLILNPKPAEKVKD